MQKQRKSQVPLLEEVLPQNPSLAPGHVLVIEGETDLLTVVHLPEVNMLTQEGTEGGMTGTDGTTGIEGPGERTTGVTEIGTMREAEVTETGGMIGTDGTKEIGGVTEGIAENVKKKMKESARQVRIKKRKVYPHLMTNKHDYNTKKRNN